jgi:hypothetical protein
MSEAVLGFRPHTYWTAVVALAGPAQAPAVIERRRMVFAEGEEQFVFHQAAELEPAVAEALIGRIKAQTRAKAAHGISALLETLRGSGVSVSSAVVPVGKRPAPEDLEQIRRSHTLMHAAEGHFYRDVVAEACIELGLELARPPEHGLAELLGVLLDPARASPEVYLKELGAKLGPPWSEDQRLAAMAAWLQLLASGEPGRAMKNAPLR